MSWADLRRAAIEQAALAVLVDPQADEATRSRARDELERGEDDLDLLSLAELDVYIHLIDKLTARPIATDHAQVAERARSYQEAANIRRDELDSTESVGPRIAPPRCRRCSKFEDADLAVLAEVVAEDEREEKVLDGATLALDGGRHGE